MNRQIIKGLIFVFFLVLGIQTSLTTAASPVRNYSGILEFGDEFVWDMTYYTVNVPLDYYFMNMGNNSVITLEILQNLEDVNFVGIDFSNYVNYFNLTFGDEIFNFGWDDPFHWFICPVYIDDGAGSVSNPAETQWIYYIIDDFLFESEGKEMSFSIDIINNQVNYVGSIKYLDDNTILSVNLVIDRNTGIMILIDFRVENTTGEETFTRWLIKQRGVELSTSSVSLSVILPLMIIALILIPVLTFKRRRNTKLN